VETHRCRPGVAIVDLASVDHNCERLIAFSRQNKIAWRPAYKTLRSPELLGYVVSKLDRPRVMIHHLRDLPQALPRVPAGTDFLMGYPPTLGELEHYLGTPPALGERRHTLRINVDSIALLRALAQLSTPATDPARRTTRTGPERRRQTSSRPGRRSCSRTISTV